MNRTAAAPRQVQPLPAGYRPSLPSQPQSGQGSTNAMYYATAGQQATQPSTQAPGRTIPFPPIGGIGRSGPPAFGRGADPNDFPALGGGHSAQSQSTQLQQMFMQGLAPPPPPGIGGLGTSPSEHTNGIIGSENLRGEDFPALGAPGGEKERMANFLRNSNQLPPSPPSIPNGANGSHSNSATPSTNPPHPQSGAGGAPSTADSSWARQSPSRPQEPVIRPVQQIMSSPVDKWGLKALLYEIKTSMGKGDRGILIFGEELSELGMDIASEDSLYPTFVTPWQEPSQITQPIRIEDSYHIPQCYNVQAPPVQSKLSNFAEDTLFYAFYTSPQDLLQLEVAEELFNRGWRYHTELQVWLTSPSFQNLDLSAYGPESSSQPNWVRGPFIVFDPRSFTRQKTPDDFTVDSTLLEATKPVSMILADEQGRKPTKSPIGNGNGNGMMGSLMGGFQQAVGGR